MADLHVTVKFRLRWWYRPCVLLGVILVRIGLVRLGWRLSEIAAARGVVILSPVKKSE